MKLIDADRFKNVGFAVPEDVPPEGRDSFIYGTQVVLKEIANLPPVDAVPVVRCKDCIYNAYQFPDGTLVCQCYDLAGEQPLTMFKDDFCSYGVRRGDDEQTPCKEKANAKG